ncbi:helix-turn-helix domain-containing protein [Anaerotignum sp.]|uniref:helix-turn-helix domain-containing protein n=1 Tax=Anaerotignum sp. TaxID=2039241 RepID=UPI002714660A|nr:helix-turn-helix transcriptional regulator [Anaerotignum sp.]
MDVGQRIRACRKKRGLTVDELAERLEKNRATVYRYENGTIENLPITILEPIAKALDTSPAYLMGWTENSSPTTDKDGIPALETKETFTPTEHELEVILAYRNQINMQPAVDRILGISAKSGVPLQGKIATRGFQETIVSEESNLAAQKIKKRLAEAAEDIDF